MRTTLLVVLLATVVSAAPRRVYALSWGHAGDDSPERRALIEQVDRRLRDELRRCGAVVEGQATPSAIVLTPSLEIFPRALKLSLIGVRDRKLLGGFSTKAAGSSRDAQLRAIVTQVCREADQLD